MMYPRNKPPPSRPHSASPSAAAAGTRAASPHVHTTAAGETSQNSNLPSPFTRDRSAGNSTGRTPTDVHQMAEVDQSIHVLKMIYSATGNKLKPSGHSQFDTLSSVGVQPVSIILRHKRWQDFFQTAAKKGLLNSTADLSERPSTAPSNNARLSTSFEPAKSNSNNRENNNEDMLDADETFRILKKRIQSLWKDVKMCQSDVDFYSFSMLRSSESSMEQFENMSRYLLVLNNYRLSTIAVMDAIRSREAAVHRLIETLAQVNRRKSNLGTLKASIVADINETQRRTVNVIHHIQNWRMNFWRPLAFGYVVG